jgi:hypothetical protein
LTTSEFVTLAVLLAAAIAGTAILVSWMVDQQRILAPEPTADGPADDLT